MHAHRWHSGKLVVKKGGDRPNQQLNHTDFCCLLLILIDIFNFDFHDNLQFGSWKDFRKRKRFRRDTSLSHAALNNRNKNNNQ